MKSPPLFTFLHVSSIHLQIHFPQPYNKLVLLSISSHASQQTKLYQSSKFGPVCFPRISFPEKEEFRKILCDIWVFMATLCLHNAVVISLQVAFRYNQELIDVPAWEIEILKGNKLLLNGHATTVSIIVSCLLKLCTFMIN